MPRFFIKLAFKGTHYHGWQIQANASSVQSIIDNSLSLLLQEKIKTLGAGRTDKGVHAKEFYAHFDTLGEKNMDTNFITRLNSFLPKDIAVYKIFKVNDDLHARFGAISRTYEYQIHQKKNPFFDGFSYYIYKPLDIEKMNEAAQILLQYKNFKCFSKTHIQVKNFICHVTFAQWKEDNCQLVFTIKANRFLRNMVRAIVGTLLKVGCGELTIEEFIKIIESGNRSQASESVKACGLYLTKIEYPINQIEC